MKIVRYSVMDLAQRRLPAPTVLIHHDIERQGDALQKRGSHVTRPVWNLRISPEIKSRFVHRCSRSLTRMIHHEKDGNHGRRIRETSCIEIGWSS